MTQVCDRSQRALTRLSVFGFILFALLFSACQKQEAETIQPNFTSIWEKKLSTSCANCHRPCGNAWEANVLIDFREKVATYNWLLNSNVNGLSGKINCANVRITVPASPDQSYLIGILIDSYNKDDFAGEPGCMPINDHIVGQFASPQEQEAILTWIQNGALID